MQTTITVEGMTCEHCEQTVEDALSGVPGVTSAVVDREAEQASIEGDAPVVSLVQAVEDAGYTAQATGLWSGGVRLVAGRYRASFRLSDPLADLSVSRRDCSCDL